MSTLVWLAVSAAVSQQRFSRQPDSRTVREGDTVTLECSVTDKAGVLQWTKDDFGLGTERSLPGYTRFSMAGTSNTSWNLQITNITVADEAKYQCQVGATDTVAPIRSKYAVIRVLAAAQPPVLTVRPVMTTREGKIAMIQCISKGGKPASLIKWSLNGQQVTSGIEEKVTEMEETKKMMTVSTLKFPATINLSGSELACEATSEAEPSAQSIKTRVEVQYKPKTRIIMTGSSDKVYEGDKVSLLCNATAEPAVTEYRWYVTGEEVKEAKGGKEFIVEAARDMNGKKITCIARNALGQISADYMLDIQCEYLIVSLKTWLA